MMMMNNNTSQNDYDSNDSSSDDEELETESLPIDETDDSVGTSNVHRTKRSDLSWCGVDTEANFPQPRMVVWPPPSTSTAVTQHNFHEEIKRTRWGNPLYGPRMQLYSRTGHFLAVYPDGTVRGTPDENDLHTYLEIVSAGYPGHVKIKGMLTNMFVAMDNKGRLYSEADGTNEATVFIESFQGSYNAYLSRNHAHSGWYLGIKKSGKFKRGQKTAYGQKAVRFLPRRTKFE